MISKGKEKGAGGPLEFLDKSERWVGTFCLGCWRWGQQLVIFGLFSWNFDVGMMG